MVNIPNTRVMYPTADGIKIQKRARCLAHLETTGFTA